jgi:hypothetical protein
MREEAKFLLDRRAIQLEKNAKIVRQTIITMLKVQKENYSG